MCLVWKYRLALSIFLVLVLMTCGVHSTENEAHMYKMYPRGNHWAVGHLMGKKSTDGQYEESDRASEQYLPSAEEDGQLDRSLRPCRLVGAFIRALVGLESEREGDASQRFQQRALDRKRQWEEQRERDQKLKEVTDLLLQAFNRKENNST